MPKPRPHPPHQVREIRSLGTDTHVGWSLYPDQLAPMHRHVGRHLALGLAVRFPGLTARDLNALGRTLATTALRALGLPAASAQPASRPVKGPRARA